MNTVGVKTSNSRSSEISNQIQGIRGSNVESKGAIHYSIAGISKDSGMQNMLKNEAYKEKALVPLSPWIKTAVIEKPMLYIVDLDKDITLKFDHKNPGLVRNWVLFTEYGGSWTYKIYSKEDMEVKIPLIVNGKKVNRIALKAIDRLGNESNYDYKIIK